MNRIEKEVFEIVRSKLDIDEERKKFDKLQDQHKEKQFSWDLWVLSWGKIDVEVIIKYSIKNGIPPLVFAEQWIELDEIKKMDIYLKVM